jgi:hypothetical protein
VKKIKEYEDEIITFKVLFAFAFMVIAFFVMLGIWASERGANMREQDLLPPASSISKDGPCHIFMNITMAADASRVLEYMENNNCPLASATAANGYSDGYEQLKCIRGHADISSEVMK